MKKQKIATTKQNNIQQWKFLTEIPGCICMNDFTISKVDDILIYGDTTNDLLKYFFIVKDKDKSTKYMFTEIANHEVLRDVTHLALHDLILQGWKNMKFNTFLKNQRYIDMLKNNGTPKVKNVKVKPKEIKI